MDLNEYGKGNLKELHSKRFTENRARTLTRSEFIRRLARSNDLQIKDADIITKQVFRELISCLKDGFCIKFEGFGTFGTYTRKARSVKHPVTQERCTIKEKAVVKFKPSAKLNASFQEGKDD